MDTKATVSRQTDAGIFVRFRSIGPAWEEDAKAQATIDCSQKAVALLTEYFLSKDGLKQTDYRRNGIGFGGLIVPFKFSLGKNHQITPSTTFAPYVGWRGWEPYGYVVMPLAAVGLGLVPVAKQGGEGTETKPSLTTAVGFRITSPKNSAFNAGLVIGKDFLAKSDRKSDPDVEKPWLSVYLGYSL